MLPLEIQLNSLLEELVIGLLFDPIEKFFNGKTSIGDVASLAKRFHQALVWLSEGSNWSLACWSQVPLRGTGFDDCVRSKCGLPSSKGRVDWLRFVTQTTSTLLTTGKICVLSSSTKPGSSACSVLSSIKYSVRPTFWVTIITLQVSIWPVSIYTFPTEKYMAIHRVWFVSSASLFAVGSFDLRMMLWLQTCLC